MKTITNLPIHRVITYHRNPTQWELKFGEGALHYKDFMEVDVWNHKKDKPKAWVI